MQGVIDWAFLWEAVQSQYPGDRRGIHFLDHWRRVERNGVMLAEKTGLAAQEIVVVRLFALFHDSRRIDDGHDPSHGQRGAELARAYRGKVYELDDPMMKKLVAACTRHEKGEVTVDTIIGCCWDADRLDLTRCGIWPREALMSTAEGKRLARSGISPDDLAR